MHEQIVPGTKRMRVEVRAYVVLLIDGLGHFSYSLSPTRSLRVCNGLATLLARVDTHPSLQPLVYTSKLCRASTFRC